MNKYWTWIAVLGVVSAVSVAVVAEKSDANSYTVEDMIEIVSNAYVAEQICGITTPENAFNEDFDHLRNQVEDKEALVEAIMMASMSKHFYYMANPEKAKNFCLNYKF